MAAEAWAMPIDGAWCGSESGSTFGPVPPVTVIESEADALRIVDESPFALLAGIFTRDLARGLRFAEAVRTGWVNVNEGTNYWESHLPFGGGAGADSGVGRVGGASRWSA